MSSYAATFVRPLLEDGLLGHCHHASLARLLPHVAERTLAAGESLFNAGEAAQHAFLIVEGGVTLTQPDGVSTTLTATLVGEEAGTELASYQARAVAASPLRVLAIPRGQLQALVKANPELRPQLQQMLLVRTRGGQWQPPPADLKRSDGDDGTWKEVAGWLCTLIAPALVMLFGHHWGLQSNAVMFLAVFAATVSMWVFSLVDEFVPGLFALFSILVLGLAPPAQVLAGFASDGFFLAMSVLGLGTVIVASGLSYRFLLWLLQKLPAHPFWQDVGLLLTGFVLTPLVPSINGRVALTTPLMLDMLELLHYKPGGRAATRLAVSAFTGASLLSAAFLTSKSVNFVVFGLLPAQGQDQFQWLHWVAASLVAAGVMLGLHLIACNLFYRPREAAHFSREQLTAQLALLGRLKGREWAALFGVLVFLFGVATVSIHKIQPPWLALAILYALLLFGFLRKNEFKEKIDWPFLMYLGGLVGITGGFNAVGLDKWLALKLAGLGSFMRTDLDLFLLALFAVLFVVRLAVPISATIVIAATVFMPLAEIHGVNPWVIGMAILILGEMWFFPYQCSYYVQFRDIAGRKGAYDEKSFLRYNALMNCVKLAALYASVPYWKWMGLL